MNRPRGDRDSLSEPKGICQLKRSVFFLGGMFGVSLRPYISAMSKGNLQNAADSLQSNFVLGLEESLQAPVHVINLPFVSSFPQRFKSIYFPSIVEDFGVRSAIYGRGFLNLKGLVLVSRFVSAIHGLFSADRHNGVILIVYSAHMPFVCAALLYRFFSPDCKVCLVLPDLPEFMGARGRLHTLIRFIEYRAFYRLARKFDYLVPLTRQMIARIGFDAARAVVIEGMVPVNSRDPYDEMTCAAREKKYILYTGTLAKRYNILDLVNSVKHFSELDVELWICGEGDAKEEILQAANSNPKIKYLGQVNREEAIALQRGAMLLINPRRPGEEYTRYSFPSKVMEYMMSGRPVVMYNLDGVPEEYEGYFFSPESIGVDGLGKAIRSALELGGEALDSFGERARRFVLKEKNAGIQTAKLIALFKE